MTEFVIVGVTTGHGASCPTAVPAEGTLKRDMLEPGLGRFVHTLETVVPFVEEDAPLDACPRALRAGIEKRAWPLRWEDTD